MKSVLCGSFILLLSGLVCTASAQDTGTLDRETAKKLFKQPGYSPYAGRSFPTRVYWGDTHLHTMLSMDAGAFGNRLGPDDAYRFARGEEVTSSTGQRVKLARPLDFMVIADHSDGMGFFDMIQSGDPVMMDQEEGRRWNNMINSGNGVQAALELIDKFSQGTLPWKTNDPKLMRSVWQKTIDAAEAYNEPGRFTAFIGYEWTSLVRGNNLHRVVIYRDNGDKAIRTLPFTNQDSSDPEDLWSALDGYEDKTGGQVLAIPHNGNLSNGMMFAETRNNGQPINKLYAQLRNRWEPLAEVTQIKGDGETHPLLSPEDEFADFDTWDAGNLDLSEAKRPEMLQYEYLRSALKLGLKFDEALGTNPFQYGMIGSTDSHTSLVAVEEDNFFGKHAGSEPSPERMSHAFKATDKGKIMSWQECSAGYAAVWAKENTRASLWDAMKRRETYATTGTRIVVRFFGGWEFTQMDTHNRNPANVGYAKGVPMGGALRKAPRGKSPTFLVAALKDPIGANLDRIQVVKGWLDRQGELHEKVYNVAWGDADKRQLASDGKLPAVGSTVDVTTATWTNTIGDPELIGVWTDPDFDPAERAFYYTRVLEIPTPRWTCYDAVRFGIEVPPNVPLATQERAYTSPIWYTP